MRTGKPNEEKLCMSVARSPKQSVVYPYSLLLTSLTLSIKQAHKIAHAPDPNKETQNMTIKEYITSKTLKTV